MYDITFIIPTYNNKKLLFRCLKSIVPQLMDNDAIIVIDDGSTDDTFQSVKDAYGDNSKIKIVRQINSGSGVARNLGITLNNNKYIWFVDSDDYIDQHSIEKIRKEIDTSDVDIVYFDYYLNNENEESIVKLNINPDDKISLMLSAHFPWNKIIKAELFKNIKFPTGRIRYQDHGTIPLAVSKGTKIKYINKPFYIYDFSHPNNISKNNEKNDDMYFAFENILKYYGKGFLNKEELEVLFISTFIFSQIYNPPTNSFQSIYLNSKKVKRYLDREFPKWRKSWTFSRQFRKKYLKQVDQLSLKTFNGKIFRWSSILPSIAIFLYKKRK